MFDGGCTEVCPEVATRCDDAIVERCSPDIDAFGLSCATPGVAGPG